MPKFLERKLKAEDGAHSAIPYKVMNTLGYMHGNKETAKGAAAEKKHDRGKNLGKHLHAKGGGSVATRIRERMK